jgi:hypothetical protein
LARSWEHPQGRPQQPSWHRCLPLWVSGCHVTWHVAPAGSTLGDGRDGAARIEHFLFFLIDMLLQIGFWFAHCPCRCLVDGITDGGQSVCLLP